jgi:7-cyano-7-deazaguanine synthase
MPNAKAIVLLSGGLDSSTILAMAQAQDFDLYAMSFAYGQRQHVELQAAKTIANHFAVTEHRLVEINLRAFGGSALTDDIEVPKDRDESAMAAGIPLTYVPARNTIFLSYALAWAEVLEAKDIFIGVNAVDYSGYPDCRPEFIEAFTKMANLATKIGTENNEHISIHAPLIDLSKADIIKAGCDLGVDYSLTHSCYDPILSLACGHCDACILRRQGFEAANIDDPTSYASKG